MVCKQFTSIQMLLFNLLVFSLAYFMQISLWAKQGVQYVNFENFNVKRWPKMYQAIFFLLFYILVNLYYVFSLFVGNVWKNTFNFLVINCIEYLLKKNNGFNKNRIGVLLKNA